MITDKNDQFQPFDDDYLNDDIQEQKSAYVDLFDNRVDLDKAHHTKPTPYEFVLPWLPRGEVGSIISPGGTGKSMMALQLAHAVANGLTTFLDGTGCGPVAYFSMEDSQKTLSMRSHYVTNGMPGVNIAVSSKNIEIHDWSARYIDLLNNIVMVELITQKLKALECRLCFFDTLVGTHKADENDNVEMAKLILRFRQIAQGANCAVVFLHHTNKSAVLNGLSDTQQAVRGASALTDNVRWQSYMAVMSEKESEEFGVPKDERKQFVRWGLSKVNYGPNEGDFWFKRGDHGVLKPVMLYKPTQSISGAKKPSYPSVKGGV